MADVKLKCACGSLEGIAEDVRPETVNRCVCYCDSCQSFAHYLDKAGVVLDENGGSEIIQVSPAAIRFTKGEQYLECIRLTPKGPLRWFASCCNTPVANTVEGSRLPFAGLIRPIFSFTPKSDPVDTLGPVRGTVHGRHAVGDTSRVDLHPGIPPGMALRLALMILKWKFQGAARKSPFHFRDDTVPTLVSKQEREALKRAKSTAD